MPLLPQNLDPISEPIFKKLFEVVYISNDISKEEKDILLEVTYKVKKNKFYVNINADNIVIKILQKLNKFSIKIIVHNKNGNIIGIYFYNNCEFINLMEDLIDFDWGNNDICKPKLEIKYDTIRYVAAENYVREQKLNRILNNISFN